MTTSVSAPRTVAVELLSVRDELARLVRFGTAIVLGIWVYLAASLRDDNPASRGLLPYQAMMQDRPAVEQRIFRELQEGLLEAEAARSATGAWPDVSQLADAGIPPFAPDPTLRISYRWQRLREGNYINYLARPIADGSAAAWLILIQEPEPGVPPDQSFEDEEHHRLLDGTMLHVSAWTHTLGEKVADKILKLPQVEGWIQLYAVRPGQPTRSGAPSAP